MHRLGHFPSYPALLFYCLLLWFALSRLYVTICRLPHFRHMPTHTPHTHPGPITMNMAASLDQSLGIFDYLPKAETPSLSNSMTDMGSGNSSMRGHEEEDDEESGEGQGLAQSFSSSFPACASSTTTDTSGTATTTTTTGTAAVNVSVGAITGTRKRTASSRAQGASDDKRQKKLELNRLASRVRGLVRVHAICGGWVEEETEAGIILSPLQHASRSLFYHSVSSQSSSTPSLLPSLLPSFPPSLPPSPSFSTGIPQAQKATLGRAAAIRPHLDP